MGLCALLLALPLITLPASAETQPFGRAQLTVQGNRLTLYGDSQTNDRDQTVNAGEKIRIRTFYGSAGNACRKSSGSNPSLVGLKIIGELSGLELPQPLSFKTIPGRDLVRQRFPALVAVSRLSFADLHSRGIVVSPVLNPYGIVHLQIRRDIA